MVSSSDENKGEEERERVVPRQSCYCIWLVEHGGVNVSLITLTHNAHPVMGMEQRAFSYVA